MPIIQFSVHKSTEPIQPQTLQKFPIFCDLKSPVTSPEVVNYSKRTTKAEQTPKEVVAFTEQGKDQYVTGVKKMTLANLTVRNLVLISFRF